MNWTKKSFTALVSLFVLVNLTNAINYETVHERIAVLQKTELLEIKKNHSSKAIGFEIAQKSQHGTFTPSFGARTQDQRQAELCNANSSIAFTIQNNIRLNYKSILLNIVLNDILQQKSYWT